MENVKFVNARSANPKNYRNIYLEGNIASGKQACLITSKTYHFLIYSLNQLKNGKITKVKLC